MLQYNITSDQRIFDNRLHHMKDFSLGKFNVTLDRFCSQPIWTTI